MLLKTFERREAPATLRAPTVDPKLTRRVVLRARIVDPKRVPPQRVFVGEALLTVRAMRGVNIVEVVAHRLAVWKGIVALWTMDDLQDETRETTPPPHYYGILLWRYRTHVYSAALLFSAVILTKNC